MMPLDRQSAFIFPGDFVPGVTNLYTDGIIILQLLHCAI